MVNSIKFYENRTKKRYSKICYTITLFFFILLSVLLLLYGINNYNKIKVYSINSKDTLLMNGKIIFNPSQRSLIINKIIYDDIYTGTDLELLVKGVNIKIGTDEKIFIEVGNLEFFDTNEVKPINEYLTEISIDDVESYNTDGNYIKESDIKNLKIIIEYIDENEKINSLEYSIDVSKEFANTKLFY